MRFRERWVVRGAALFTFGAIVATAACGGSSSGNGPGGASGDACGALFDAESTLYANCDPTAGAFLGSRDRAVASCALSVNAPGASSSLASALQTCASAVKGEASSCNGADPGDACKFPAGTLANGAACGVDVQCASNWCKGGGVTTSATQSGTTVTVTTVAACGVCTPTIAVGQACTSNDRCADGTTCALPASGTGSGTCVAVTKNDVGGSCAPPAECKSGLHCANGTCAAPADVGGACTFPDDCKYPLTCTNGACAQGKAAGGACMLSSDCARNLVCDATTTTCVAPAAADAGAACDLYSHPCKVGQCQVTDTVKESGTCPTVIPDGQACTQPMTGQTCDVDAYCINGKCQMFDPSTCK